MIPTKRRILHKIRIDEISGVDNPCQEHARMIIMKRDTTLDPAADVAVERLALLKSKITGLSAVLSKQDSAAVEGTLHVPRYVSGARRKQKLAEKLEKLRATVEKFGNSRGNHNRDEGGKFSSGGGTSGDRTTPAKSKEDTNNPARQPGADSAERRGRVEAFRAAREKRFARWRR